MLKIIIFPGRVGGGQEFRINIKRVVYLPGKCWSDGSPVETADIKCQCEGEIQGSHESPGENQVSDK